MADHGTPEYATATGNDYAAHQGTYKFFVKLTLVSTLALVGLMISLAIGGVNGHWGLSSLGVLALLVTTAIGFASDTGRPALVGGVLVVLLLLLVVTS
ncbi:aa3-type cytochrome c oxidase subunit IV [Ancylobacter sp. 6x-1]|uniref:Aa3-type cytochrome c oxidase subunit IV n=1 Tax=Ancylobacter crimeensis TaxID=2579147 RepID=A0ABT0DET5_9HYPH|nr:aa3-type cytochrome c oxidase subunit IV [Ancylobacter crimeensis]MCK0198384.1 aa3-type cytochrome c oxidase subunit IV [Ancylobacter crimeensis]